MRRQSDGTAKGIVPTPIMEEIANAPAPRYWISEKRAAFVISSLEQGKELPSNTTPQRRRLYLHLYDIYKIERAKHPDKSLILLMFDIVNSPAPESFISPVSIPKFIIEYREQRKKKRLESLRQFNERCKDNLSNSIVDADKPIRDNTTPDGIEVRTDQHERDVHKDDVYVDARQSDTSAGEHILPPVADVPVKRKSNTPHRSRTDFSNPSKRFNRCHTNHRYIRGQLSIMWDRDM